VLLLLVLLVISPQLYFYTKLLLSQGKKQECEWLNHPPLVCAHAGDTSQAPPNTMAAFRLALDMHVDCIEVDASRTRDGVLVALHDRDLQKMSGISSVHVGDLNASQIYELDAGAGFPEQFHQQQVLTIKSVLRLVAKHVNQVIIDAKVGPPHFEEGMAAAIFSLIRETGCNNCIMWAKADRIVQEFMYLSQDPGSVGYIVMNDTVSGKVTELLRMEGAHVVGAYHGLVTKKLVTTAHRAGKRLHAWTVDDESVMQRTLKAGVDAIITSLPGVLQRVMSSNRQQCMVNGFS